MRNRNAFKGSQPAAEIYFQLLLALPQHVFSGMEVKSEIKRCSVRVPLFFLLTVNHLEM